ncbi:MAG: gamma carbonic anhydrase family protein [Acidimicrobiia bacterium]|nr:gamma carbonic anhydrase family protein [Acidimicrobiia bacterium]
MLIEHAGKSPRIHESAWVAPNATVAGDVEIGPDARVLFGAVISADGGPVRVGSGCVIMENAVLRGTSKYSLIVGDRVLVGPHAYLSGCTVGDEAFLATGTAVFNGAQVGRRAEVRVNGVVHLKTVLPDEAVVPIGWVAVGDPASILPPGRHDEIWAIQEPLDFPQEVFGVDRSPEMMTEIMTRYARGLSRHSADRIVQP